jgi:hypothetical protein
MWERSELRCDICKRAETKHILPGAWCFVGHLDVFTHVVRTPQDCMVDGKPCCDNEKRSMAGGCLNCGSPCF